MISLPNEILVIIASYLDTIMPLALSNKKMYALSKLPDIQKFYNRNVRKTFIMFSPCNNLVIDQLIKLDYMIAKYSPKTIKQIYNINPDDCQSITKSLIIDTLNSKMDYCCQYAFIDFLVDKAYNKPMFSEQEFLQLCKITHKSKTQNGYKLLQLIVTKILNINGEFDNFCNYAIINDDINLLSILFSYHFDIKLANMDMQRFSQFLQLSIENRSEDICLYLLNLPLRIFCYSICIAINIFDIKTYIANNIDNLKHGADIYRINRIVCDYKYSTEHLIYKALIYNCQKTAKLLTSLIEISIEVQDLVEKIKKSERY